MKKYEIIKNLVKMLSNELVENLGILENLKLYDVAYLEDLDEFSWNAFLEDSYENFCEILHEKNCCLNNLGRTSSFYVDVKENSWLFDFYEKNDYEKENNMIKKKIMVINEFMIREYNIYIESWNYEPKIGKCVRKKLSDIEHEINEELDGWNNLTIDDFKKEFKNYIEDLENIKYIYEYIEDFKKNQVEKYNSFISEL